MRGRMLRLAVMVVFFLLAFPCFRRALKRQLHAQVARWAPRGCSTQTHNYLGTVCVL